MSSILKMIKNYLQMSSILLQIVLDKVLLSLKVKKICQLRLKNERWSQKVVI